jgi:selenocysteine lyase/cysteine desulfurase
MTHDAFSPQEIMEIRSATPGTSRVVHFNNAGASLMPRPVADKIFEYLTHELNYGGYETAEKFASNIESTYARLARYLNCDVSAIALTENATAAWSQAFLSIPFEPGDTIITSASEYASNYIPFLQLQKKIGVNIKPVPCDSFGQADPAALSAMMDERVKLIAITHIPTNGGLVNPAIEIGKIASENKVWYLLDACQSAGQMPLDVKQIQCDFLSATSRKFLRGPRGAGFLYASARTSTLEPAILDLHAAEWKSSGFYLMRSDARKYENWESNLAGVVGLGEAVNYMLDLGVDRIWQRIRKLSEYLRTRLNQVPGLQVQDLGKIRCGIVSFTAPVEAVLLKNLLHQNGFNVSVIRPAHTLLDMQQRNLGTMTRASVHYYNTEEEIDRFAEQLKILITG